MREEWNIGSLDRCHVARGRSESSFAQPQKQRAECNEKANRHQDCEDGLPCEGRAYDKEFGHEYAERRQSGNCYDTEYQAPAEHRVALGEPAYLAEILRPLRL